jgi:hypothetical protein
LLALVLLPLALSFCLRSGTTMLMGLRGVGTPAMREWIAEQQRDDDVHQTRWQIQLWEADLADPFGHGFTRAFLRWVYGQFFIN